MVRRAVSHLAGGQAVVDTTGGVVRPGQTGVRVRPRGRDQVAVVAFAKRAKCSTR